MRELGFPARKHLWTLLLLVLVGLALRLYHLEQKSLWSDEICTIASALGNSVDPNAWQASGQAFDPASPQPAAWYLAKATTSHGLFAFGETVRVLKQNIHPPFFFWMMNPMLLTFGTSSLALRLLPVLFGVLCIPLLFLVGRQLGGSRLGLLAASLMTLSGYQIAHAQDARQYTFLTFLALASAWLILRLLEVPLSPKARRWYWAGFILLSAIGLYTQYFYGLFLAFLVLYALFRKAKEPQFLKALSVSLGGVVLCFLPWLPIFKTQLQFIQTEGHYTAGLWSPIQLPEIILRTLSDFVMPQEALGKILILILLLVGVFSLYQQRREKNIFVPLCFLLFWLGVILGGQILLDILKQSHTLSIRRYTLLCAPGFYLLLSYLLVNLKITVPSAKSICISVLLALIGLNTAQVLAGQKLRSDDYRNAASWVNQHWQSGDIVLVHRTGAIAVGMAYYLAPKTLMSGIPTQTLETQEDIAALHRQILQASKSSHRIWVAYSHAGSGMQKAIAAELAQGHFYTREEKKFPGVRILRFERL